MTRPATAMVSLPPLPSVAASQSLAAGFRRPADNPIMAKQLRLPEKGAQQAAEAPTAAAAAARSHNATVTAAVTGGQQTSIGLQTVINRCVRGTSGGGGS